MTLPYADPGPTRAEIDALQGPAVLEFGAPWCGICRAAQPHITAVLSGQPRLHHVKVEDGKGRPLGRSFGVKLWPTLVFLRDGREIERVVRPAGPDELAQALARLIPAGPPP